MWSRRRLVSSLCSTLIARPVLLGLFVTILLLPHHRAEEECLKSKVMCYECESLKDRSCNDPFNATDSMLKLCHGCCVKVVRGHDRPTRNIWRTCTSRLQINLFMVDHVCMEESGGTGHMCFCESDKCNGAGDGRERTFLPPMMVGLVTQLWHSSPAQSIPLLLAQPAHTLAGLLLLLLLSVVSFSL